MSIEAVDPIVFWAPGIEVDVARSTVTIAGRQFPAVAVIPPGRLPELFRLRGWGDEARRTLYVPMENGALVELSRGLGVTAFLDHRLCSRWGVFRGYLPIPLKEGARRLSRGGTRHDGCEPEWLSAWIERVSQKRVVEITGDVKEPELVPLRRAEELWRQQDVE